MSMDADLVKAAIREVLAERSTVDSDVHREQHQFLTEAIPLLRDFLAYRAVRMEQIKKREAIWQKARDSAIGFAAVSCVVAIFGALGWVGKLVISVGIHFIQHGSGPSQ